MPDPGQREGDVPTGGDSAGFKSYYDTDGTYYGNYESTRCNGDVDERIWLDDISDKIIAYERSQKK